MWPGCAGAKFGWPSEGRNRRLVRERTSRSSGLGTCDGRPASGATVNYSPYAASGPRSSTTSERGGVETRTTPSFGPLKRVRTVSVRANIPRDQSVQPVRPLRLRGDPSGAGFARLRSDRLPSPPDLRQFPSSSQPLCSATRVPRETCRWRRRSALDGQPEVPGLVPQPAFHVKQTRHMERPPPAFDAKRFSGTHTPSGGAARSSGVGNARITGR